MGSNDHPFNTIQYNNNQTNPSSKCDKSTKKIVDKTKIDRIRSQQIRESCGIQPINEWVERREWEEHVARMDAETLVKISRDNIPAGRRSPGRPKRRWSDLIIDKNRQNHLQRRRRTEIFPLYCIALMGWSLLP